MSFVSIARPLYEDLSIRPFSGHIVGLFYQACNVIDADQRVIALTSPTIGNGPFSIVIKGITNFAGLFKIQHPVSVTPHDLMIGEWHINLNHADIWEPEIFWPKKTYIPAPPVVDLLKPYTHWPQLQIDTPAAKSIAHRSRRLANELAQALVQKTNIEESVAHLAGLGSGLTPAGDDYLMGVMTALWLTGRSELPSKIAAIACSKTTALSAAFLTAASYSHFVEAWHNLIQALLNEDHPALKKAIKQISQFGATSGIDALAGFATTLLISP